jgi:hypothetical protein
MILLPPNETKIILEQVGVLLWARGVAKTMNSLEKRKRRDNVRHAIKH